SEDLSGPVFRLHEDAQLLVDEVVSDERYACLDRTAHLAIAASRETSRLGSNVPMDVGLVSIGTSRGATTSLEESYEQFSKSCGRVPALTSPVTTAGALSSWVAQDLLFSKSKGTSGVLPLTTSMTCTSALHSLITAKAFVESSMVESALFGGSEASLTPFTQAQVEALRIGAKGAESSWPSRPCGLERPGHCGLVLGEVAGTAVLLRERRECACEDDLVLYGVGWGIDNRTLGFRKVGHGPSTRVENRIPGADAVSYLAFAGNLAGGLYGIRHSLELGDPFTGNGYTASDVERIPWNLPDAIEAWRSSQAARECFGDDVHHWILRSAETEWASFNRSVTDWELRRYFERI
ncbi:MAG: hypothetical protein EBS71_00280, partial [Actinobacteria bacterium]|nr:hypothetical protein [Actinomycetota bacterium]